MPRGSRGGGTLAPLKGEESKNLGMFSVFPELLREKTSYKSVITMSLHHKWQNCRPVSLQRDPALGFCPHPACSLPNATVITVTQEVLGNHRLLGLIRRDSGSVGWGEESIVYEASWELRCSLSADGPWEPGPGPLTCRRPCIRKTLVVRCVCRFPSCLHPQTVSREEVHQSWPFPPFLHGPRIWHSFSECHPINSLALRGSTPLSKSLLRILT